MTQHGFRFQRRQLFANATMPSGSNVLPCMRLIYAHAFGLQTCSYSVRKCMQQCLGAFETS